MADYITLGARPVQAAPDTTQRNTGNYTNYFSGAELGVNVPYFEIYHILFTGARVLDTVTIWIGSAQWSFAAAGFGGGAEWDPESPMLLRPGDEVYFFWSTPDSVPTGPLVTCWLRFDIGLPANKPYIGKQ